MSRNHLSYCFDLKELYDFLSGLYMSPAYRREFRVIYNNFHLKIVPETYLN